MKHQLKRPLVVWCLSIAVTLPSLTLQAQKSESKNSLNFELKSDAHYKKTLQTLRYKNKNFNQNDVLVGRAVLPATSFAKGPTSGLYLGNDSINGQALPFINKQPIQGFSSVLNNHDGTFMALSDNGFGALENSADYNLRLYKIKPNFKTAYSRKGKGGIDVLDFVELKDPKKQIPFTITNAFSKERVLTGADFDIESVQQTNNGDFWIGDEFGPFILHFNNKGVLLEPPYALPNFSKEGQELRAPQNPFNEEYAAQRVMNAMRAHALANGSTKTPVMSTWFVMLDDDDETTLVKSRATPKPGLAKASSEIFNVASLNRQGFPVTAYTVNDTENMIRLLKNGLQGIITDRPDLLLEAVQNFDGNNDGKADYLDKDGLIDVNLFDAQGHRGARNLRPENTLPAMEVALDYLMPTLETDCGITLDGLAILNHDPHIESAKSRKRDGTSYEFQDEVLIKEMTLTQIQDQFVADKLLSGRPVQTNDLALSPVSVNFAAERNLTSPYVMPSLQQLFDFVEFYITYYKTGAGATTANAEKRWKNASKVRFNIETKINPRTDVDNRGDVFASRTFDAATFTNTVAQAIITNGLEDRADIQSFDFRTLLLTHKNYPNIRTVCLFGDFPKVGNRGDGTNLQDQNGQNTPWLAGLYWPYRKTKLDNPFLVPGSGGFEGMAITPDQTKLLTLLEKPLVGAPKGELLIHEFDIAKKSYNGKKYSYQMNEDASAIGDFVMFSKTRGLIIERDGSQGNLEGFKSIFEVNITDNDKLEKRPNLDLLQIQDLFRISLPGEDGDVGIGKDFAFPFVTIESVVVLNPFLVGVLNDNNYPFSVGRHVGANKPDDNEFILVWLDEPLGRKWKSKKNLKQKSRPSAIDAYPNTFSNNVTISCIATEKQTVSITIYNTSGRQVKKLVDTKLSDATAKFLWNGRSDTGVEVESGVYIAVIESNGQFFKKKLIKN